MDTNDLILTVKNERNSFFLTPFNQNVIQFKIYSKAGDKDMSHFKNIFEIAEDRSKFLITEYLRVRAKKILKNRIGNLAFMSDREKDFYSEIKGMYKEAEKKNHVVAFIALENLGTVKIGGRDIFIREDDLYICFFLEIETFLYESKIRLLYNF